MRRKILFIVLILSFIFSLSIFADEKNHTKYLLKQPGLDTYKELTESEYLQLTGRKVIPKQNMSKSGENVVTLWYEYTMNTSWTAYDNLYYRVSNTVDHTANNMSISYSISLSRSVEYSGGATFTADVWDAVQLGISSQFSSQVSASSSLTTSYEFRPNPQYRYNWIAFQPKFFNAEGTLVLRENSNGVQMPDVAVYYNVHVKYPYIYAGFLDGHFTVHYTNNANRVPNALTPYQW